MIKNLCKAVPDFLRTISTPHKEILIYTHSLAVIHEKIIQKNPRDTTRAMVLYGNPMFLSPGKPISGSTSLTHEHIYIQTVKSMLIKSKVAKII